MRQYLLDGKTPVPCDDLPTWCYAYEKMNRRVAQDEINGVTISTVFLALDHQYGDGPPLLFETMIFGGELDQEQWRYATWEEAEAGHRQALQKVASLN